MPEVINRIHDISNFAQTKVCLLKIYTHIDGAKVLCQFFVGNYSTLRAMVTVQYDGYYGANIAWWWRRSST